MLTAAQLQALTTYLGLTWLKSTSSNKLRLLPADGKVSKMLSDANKAKAYWMVLDTLQHSKDLVLVQGAVPSNIFLERKGELTEEEKILAELGIAVEQKAIELPTLTHFLHLATARTQEIANDQSKKASNDNAPALGISVEELASMLEGS